MQGGFEGASSCIAQWIAFVARGEKAQIMRRMEEVFVGDEGGDGSAGMQGPVPSQRNSSSQQSCHQFESFVAGLSSEKRESTRTLLTTLQTFVWEGINSAEEQRQQREQQSR